MNGSVPVVDTNFVLDFLKGYPAHVNFMRAHIGRVVWISVITEIELFSFHALTEKERDALSAFMASVVVASLDERIKDIAIAFRRATRHKLPDSIIAATAISLGAVLMTNDDRLKKAKFPGFAARAL